MKGDNDIPCSLVTGTKMYNKTMLIWSLLRVQTNHHMLIPSYVVKIVLKMDAQLKNIGQNPFNLHFC